MPQIFIVLFPTFNSSYANFGFVSVVIIADAVLSQINLLCLDFNFSTRSFIFSSTFWTGNFSPITPVDANKMSLIFTVSLIPVSDLDSFIVKHLLNFFDIMSRLSKPCLPVNVFAFFVFTNNAFILFLFDFWFHLIDSETMLLVVTNDA